MTSTTCQSSDFAATDPVIDVSLAGHPSPFGREPEDMIPLVSLMVLPLSALLHGRSAVSNPNV
jgi:hypothetical protein